MNSICSIPYITVNMKCSLHTANILVVDSDVGCLELTHMEINEFYETEKENH